MESTEKDSAGKAYGLFYCDAPEEKIRAELQKIREDARTPAGLELSLIKGLDNFEGDQNLTLLAQGLKRVGINYALLATYSDGTNEDTAKELGDILNSAYRSPLYEQGARFDGVVVYKEGDDYIFRD